MSLKVGNFTKITEIRNQLSEELKKVGRDTFSEIFMSFFDSYPDEHLIKITGIIPYFNDGDSCVFTIYEPELFTKEEWDGDPEGDEDEDDRYYKEGRSSWNLDKSSEKYKDFQDLYKILEDNEDAVIAAFGEHFKLYVTREGIKVEEYTNHD